MSYNYCLLYYLTHYDNGLYLTPSYMIKKTSKPNPTPKINSKIKPIRYFTPMAYYGSYSK